MSDQFLGEIRMFGFNFPPRSWAFCNGQFLPIAQNQALFSLLGTMYGGNGQTTFALPDLRGRVPMHKSVDFTQGERGGQEVHTVTQSEMPAHLHLVNAVTAQATVGTPTNAVTLAQSTASQLYGPAAAPLVTMAANMVSSVGGSQPHENRSPYLVINFCIALTGIFPSQN